MKKHAMSSHAHTWGVGLCVALCIVTSVAGCSWHLTKLLFCHTHSKVSPHNRKFSSFFFLFSRVFLIFKLTSFLKSILVISWLLFKLGWRSSKANSVTVIFFLALSGFGQTPFRKVWGILFTHSCCISCCHPSRIIKKTPCRFPHTLLHVKAQS